MPITKQLYDLQEIDTDIEHTQQTLDLKNSQVGKRDILDSALAHLNDEKKKLEELQHQRREAEAEFEDMTSKITATEKQLYDGKITNSKELSELQHELNNLKNINDQLETKALEIIDRVEIAEKSLATMNADFQKLEEEWQQQQKQLATDIEVLKSTLTNLTEKRRLLTTQIESPALNLYERVRQQKKQAVAKVEQGICRACRISISSSNLQKARSGQPVQCGTCGRILFIS
jgi:predicted  nucleic acid-binding Zn-ribbon protein